MNQKRRSIFEMIDAPEKGWVTHQIKRVTTLDSPTQWLVELIRESDGLMVSFETGELYVAWARATEKAHQIETGLILVP